MIHKSNNVIGRLTALGLYINSIAWFYAGYVDVWYGIVMGVGLLVPIPLIRSRKIELRNDIFTYREYAYFPFINIKKAIPISSIRYIERRNTRACPLAFLYIFIPKSWRELPHPDALTIHLLNDTFSFVGFGKEAEFDEFIQALEAEIIKRPL